MTGRATFGDFAAQVTHHLSRLPAPAAPRRRGAAPASVGQAAAGAQAVLHALAGYTRDLTTLADALPAEQRKTTWPIAARRARRALANASAPFGSTTLARAQGHPGQARARDPLMAAAVPMLLGRELLNTHFGPALPGEVSGRSEWALVLGSAPVIGAVLYELVAWARQIGPYCAHVAVTGHDGTPENRRALTAASQWLSVLSAAAEAAYNREPVRAAHLDLLYAVPVNILPEPQRPAGGEPVQDLCRGIITTSERLRAGARIFAAQAIWSPALTRESLRRAASYGTVISWNCALILRTLADRTSRPRPQLSAQLDQATHAADQARAAWLTLARSWDYVSTDARGQIAQTTAETWDLALWTGRLAYADPAWTPEIGPSRAVRDPHDLVPSMTALPLVVAAVHHASHTLGEVAGATARQLETASRVGRLLVPTRSLPGEFDIPYRLAPAPPDLTQPLLNAYHGAATASEQLTAQTGQAAAIVNAPSRTLTAARDVIRMRSASGHQRQPPAPRNPVPAVPGPAERTLLNLDVRSPADLRRAADLDTAIDQLIIRAATGQEPYAPVYPANLNTSAGTAELLSHLLADKGDDVPNSLLAPGVGDRPAAGWTVARGHHVVRAQLPVSPVAARQARGVIREALAEWGLTALTDDAELLASELVANAAEHARGQPIRLSLREHTLASGRSAITCDVTDSSPRLPKVRTPDLDSERGRGLAIVAELAWASGTTLHPDGKTISFVLAAPAEPRQEARSLDMEAEP